MKIVIDSDIPYIMGVFEPFAQVVYLRGDGIGRADVADADALVVRTRTRCDEALLAGSRVRIVASATIGFDHIETQYCASRGIRVATAAGSNARGVLQWIGAGLVAMQRRQGWLTGQRTIGVVGVGSVGSLVAEYAKRWGFEVLCCDPPRERKGEYAPDGGAFVSLGEIAERADIITFHTPLTHSGDDATWHLADSDFFERLNVGATTINTSRGAVVDTNALVVAIRSGRCDALIDTWENEPNISEELLDLATIATPHVAGYSVQGKMNASSMVVRAVAECLELPLTEWHPGDGSVAEREPISWEELCETIGEYYDIEAESNLLKKSPHNFEAFRNGYRYRREYF